MYHEDKFTKDLDMVLREARDMLIAKNKSYGDSALNPIRIFAKSDTMEQIRVRMDDKLNRMMNGVSFSGDNDIKDLLGYLIIYLIAEKRQNEK